MRAWIKERFLRVVAGLEVNAKEEGRQAPLLVNERVYCKRPFAFLTAGASVLLRRVVFGLLLEAL